MLTIINDDTADLNIFLRSMKECDMKKLRTKVSQ